MKKFLFLSLIFLSTFCAANETPSSFNPKERALEPQIITNNRPLAKINGKVISLVDVIKKMDLFLYEYDPNMKLSAPEKVQFYMSRWEDMLDEMVCNELVLLDAKQKEIEVTDGEVREEIENRFGPHILPNLEALGFTIEEAEDWIRNEQTLRQMMWYKVHSKVLQSVTPQVIKEAYQAYAEQNPPTDNWTYRVLSVRGKEQNICEEVAREAYSLLVEKGKDLESVTHELQENHEGITLAVTEDLSADSTTISTQHLQGIKDLDTQAYSKPVSQISRFDKSHVARIFYLDSHSLKLPSEFDAMHEPIKNKLLNELAEKERDNYFLHLKKRYGIEKEGARLPLPKDYQPFVIY